VQGSIGIQSENDLGQSSAFHVPDHAEVPCIRSKKHLLLLFCWNQSVSTCSGDEAHANSPSSGLVDSSWEAALGAPDLRDMLADMMDSGPGNE
jgi:hypothetical protein